jgi:hypothetical protein
VGSAPGNLPWPEQPRLWLPPSQQAIRSWRLFNTPDDADWQYPLEWHTPVMVPKAITHGTEWIYAVHHDHDGDWACVDGFDHPNSKDWELVALSVIIDLDETIAEVLDLAPGERAWRDQPHTAWQRGAIGPEDDG